MNANAQASLNSKYTWRQIDRVEPPKRTVANRLSDFLATNSPYDETTAVQQASRCIQCPTPTCVEACPLAIPIPDLMSLTADGQFREATSLFLKTHSIPEVFAQVCIGQHHCEAACVLGAKSEPLPIGSIARFLLDYGKRHGIEEPAPSSSNGDHVAVVGSGLCGLVAADVLSRRGYDITVFDNQEKPGGRVVNGLPGFRVDKQLVQERVQKLRERGVQFRMGVAYGRELKLEDLREQFAAVFLGLGRAEAIDLTIPGADLNGVHQAYPFVLSNTADVTLKVPAADVQGRRVAVLGGGETAMDALRIAIRKGASEAIGLYRRDAANLAANPESYRDALEEGARFSFLSEPVMIVGDSAGKVTAVRCIPTKLDGVDGVDGAGRRRSRPSRELPFDIPIDVVLVAYGFAPPHLPEEGDFGKLAWNSCRRLILNLEQMTNLPGVFAGGSIVRGPADLVDVVRDARLAAESIDRYLASLRVARNSGKSRSNP